MVFRCRPSAGEAHSAASVIHFSYNKHEYLAPLQSAFALTSKFLFFQKELTAEPDAGISHAYRIQ